jgi:hypothetical protein
MAGSDVHLNVLADTRQISKFDSPAASRNLVIYNEKYIAAKQLL